MINEKIKDLCSDRPRLIAASRTTTNTSSTRTSKAMKITTYAHFFTNVGVAWKEGWGPNRTRLRGHTHKHMKLNQVAEERKATHCMLATGSATPEPDQCGHGDQREVGGQGRVLPAHARRDARPLGANVLPLVIGPRSTRAPSVYLKHECGTTVSISIMCHSMGNYVRKKMAPNKPAEEGGEKDKYINEQGERVEQKTDAFRFDNIFMVAADVRAGPSTRKKGVDEQGDHDGKDIVRPRQAQDPRAGTGATGPCCSAGRGLG